MSNIRVRMVVVFSDRSSMEDFRAEFDFAIQEWKEMDDGE